MSNSISLGKMSLGKMSLGRIGGEMVVSSGGGGPLYKRILASMPNELRESLVCWYSPNLQGLTNAELYNSDNLYIGGLHDLSGNGNDMDLHGFDGIEGGGHVDEDGNLCFDGLNDYGISGNNTILLTDYTVFLEASNPISNKCPQLMKGEREAASFSGTIMAINRLGYEAASFGTYTKVANGSGSVVMTPTMYNNTSITRGKNVDIDIYVYTIGRYGSSIFTSMVFRCAVVFDRTITDTEIDWVKTNMLVSQEVKKHNVGLWVVDDESGEFYCINTIKVQSGNSIGKYDEEGNVIYPTYEIDATHCTDYTWYTDIECTEEYYNDAITADVNLYCKKIRISDDMLHKLSLISLDDDSTLDEHLVVWYSPKLQGLTKKSVIEDATLEDLSGNGYDMALQGYTEESDVFDEYGWLILDGNIQRLSVNIKVPLTDFTILDSVLVVNGSSVLEGFQPSISTSADSFGYCLRGGGTAISYSLGSEKRKSIPNAMNVRGDVVVSVSSVDNCYITFNEYSYVGVPNTYSCKALSYWLKGSMEVHKEYCLLFDTTLSDTEISQVKTILKLQ